MLANHCANVYGLKTVLAECNDHRDFLKICIETDRVCRDHNQFVYKNIIFVSGEDITDRQQLIDTAEVIIYDCGCDEQRNSVLFSQADIRCVVLSASIYRMSKTYRCIEKMNGECIYACIFGDDRQIRNLSEKAGQKIVKIPFQGNPFF